MRTFTLALLVSSLCGDFCLQGSKVNEKFTPKLFRQQSKHEEIEHFQRLCAGERLRPPALDSQLKCYLLRTENGYLDVAPLKVEVASQDPFIAILRQFLTQQQSEQLIQFTIQKLAERGLKPFEEEEDSPAILSRKQPGVAPQRIHDEENTLVRNIVRAAELSTGLQAGDGDLDGLLVGQYGRGGWFHPHIDRFTPNKWHELGRQPLATFMIYLNDVRAGGATAFPRAGLSVLPETGSAVFWWNVDRAGQQDKNTRHGGCPVLQGTKWVANKWFPPFPQYHKAKCGLRRRDKFNCINCR